jgi:hypothetical protein
MSESNRTPITGKGDGEVPGKKLPFESKDIGDPGKGIGGLSVGEDTFVNETPIFDAISEDEIQAWEDYLARDFASGLTSAILNISDSEIDLKGSYAMTRDPRPLSKKEIADLVNYNQDQRHKELLSTDKINKETRKLMGDKRDFGDDDLTAENLADIFGNSSEANLIGKQNDDQIFHSFAENITSDRRFVHGFSETGEEEQLDERPPEGLDGGMQAGFAVSDEELDELPGQPAFEVPIPFESARKGMPMYDQRTNQLADLPDRLGKISNLRTSRRLKASEKLVELIITDERIDALWKRADGLQEEISEKIDDNGVASYLLEQVRSAKTLILNDRSNYEEAERALNEVAYRINFAMRLNHWTKRDARRLLIYLVFFGMLIAVGLFLLPPILRNLVINDETLLPISFPIYVKPDDIYNLVSGMMWGGLGGVVGAVFSLYKHVAWDQDFNPQHNMCYYTQPIMGIPIGAFIFLFIQIGFDVTAGATEIDIGSPFFIYLLAFVAGFQQNVVYSIVREILRLFKIDFRNGSQEGNRDSKRVGPVQFADNQSADAWESDYLP